MNTRIGDLHYKKREKQEENNVNAHQVGEWKNVCDHPAKQCKVYTSQIMCINIPVY